MLSRGGSGSTKRRRASAELGRFFFRPAQLDLEPSDLLVQLGLEGLGVLGGGPRPVGEDRLGPGQQLLLPGVDQGGVDLVLAGQLGHRLVTLDGRQGYLRLERRRVRLPLLACHLPLLWTTQLSSLIGCPVFGVHFRAARPRRSARPALPKETTMTKKRCWSLLACSVVRAGVVLGGV